MGKKEVEIIVFGAEQICASCVNLPSSKETFEWLEAAISRKFPNQPFTIRYVDIYRPEGNTEELFYSQKIINEDLFYPLVVIDGAIVGEGNPQLNKIYREMEKYGYQGSDLKK
ncbi:YuzD family protein [Bacillaceae bacterium Marseille-Q3522]|nr:YuzD family protein [Bacillaceae bacterium Marseille-Q3522]